MIEVKNVSKSFAINGERKLSVLANINIKFPDTGLYFIVGKSGSGKTTLLNILTNMLKPDQGEVLYNKENISNYKGKDLTKFYQNQIGILFQGINLFPFLTVEDNINLTKSIKGDKSFNLEKHLKKYRLEGKERVLIKNLSGGEKQRVALIRALVNDPTVLFADEPTGALDSTNGLIIFDDLKEISKNKLVIVVTHNLKIVEKYADGYLLIENSKIAFNNLELTRSSPAKAETKQIKKSSFVKYLFLKNFKTNIRQNVIAIFSIFISVLIVFVSVFAGISGKKATTNLEETYIDHYVYSVSQVYKTGISDSPLEIVKTIRPKLETCKELFLSIEDKIIALNFDYLFQGKKTLTYNEKNFEVTFRPILSGKSKDISVNKALFSLIQESDKSFALNSNLDITLEQNYEYVDFESNLSINENFTLNDSFKVTEISNELSYLSTPTLFYPYLYFADFLKEEICEKISLAQNKIVNWYSLIENARENDVISAYSYLVFSQKNYRQINQLIADGRFEKLDFKVENEPYFIVNSFKLIVDNIFLAFNVFVAISAFSSVFIISLLTYSTYLKNKKESAILTILGARKDQIFSLYLVEQLLVAFMGVSLAFFLFYFMIKPVNLLLQGYLNITNMLVFDFKIILPLVFFAFIVVIISSYLPLFFSKKIELAKELKEE